MKLLNCYVMLGIFLVGPGVAIGTAQAQTITPDGTLNTSVTQSGLNTTITNGTSAGPNLFHSFREFSIPTGGSATFDLGNTPNVATIFSRVTGGIPSSIDGLIQSSRPVNLFLLNPSGILFGANAQLNIGGSFIGTTANSIQFSDGVVFSAVNLTATPLLTVSVPIGLQFGTANGAIQVQGNGNDGIVPTNNLGMIASPGQTIALIGGDVTFTGGMVTAPVGRIEVGAVGSGTVSLTPTPFGLQFGYEQVESFRDVSLTARSALWNPYPVGNPFGGIQVVGRDIRLDQSQIAAATVGAGQGGNIVIKAQRSLDLSGVNANAQAPSAWIINQVAPGATGNGGAITVQAGQLTLQDGAAIQTLSAGRGKAGNVRVAADQILAQGAVIAPSPIHLAGVSASRIASDNFASGAGGDIAVAARQLNLVEGGQIITFVAPTASGQGGNIMLTVADTILVQGISPISSGIDGIAAVTLGSGNSGKVQVMAGNLTLLAGANVGTVTNSQFSLLGSGGSAGDVQIDIRDTLIVDGLDPFIAGRASFLGSSTQGSSNAGNVQVTARNLSVSNTGSITSNSLRSDNANAANNSGDSGSLTLQADRIEVASGSLGTFTFTNGDAKDALIQAQQIIVRDGGLITTNTAASGNAGQLTVKANDILVSGIPGFETSISSSALILDADTRRTFGLPDVPTGNTGALRLETDRLTIQNGGQVSVQHAGTGNAGELSLQANTINLNNGRITASTASGQGGNLSLMVNDALIMRQGSTISAESSGIGDGGNLNINAKFVIGLGNSDIIANAFNGNGGNIQITTQGIFGLKFRDQLTPDNDITASSQFGVSGNVQITNPGVDLNAGLLELPTDVVDPTQKIASGCAANQGSSFIVSGRGGMPVNPQNFSSDRAWADLRDVANFKPTRSMSQPDRVAAAAPPLVEATGWHRQANGQLQLFAATSAPSQVAQPATCASAPKL